MDTDIGTELFAGYENDFKLIIADISSKLQDLQDQDGESKKAAVRAAERAVEEAEEIVPRLYDALLTMNVDRPNGDGSHEHTNSSTSEGKCKTPWTQGYSRETKSVSGRPAPQYVTNASRNELRSPLPVKHYSALAIPMRG